MLSLCTGSDNEMGDNVKIKYPEPEVDFDISEYEEEE